MSSNAGVTVNVTTNAAVVAQNLGAGTQEMMDKLPYILRAFLVLTIRDLIDKSHPILGNDPRGEGGGTNPAFDQGLENLTKEINRAFTTWDNTKVGDLIMARNEAVLWSMNNPIDWRNPRLKKAWEKRDINYLYDTFKIAGWTENPTAGNFVDQPTEELHDRMRDPKTGGIRAEILKNPSLRISVRDREAIEAYIMQKKTSIGKMAGGWVKALRALGNNYPSPFDPNVGSGSASVSENGLTLKASNSYGDFNYMISKWGIVEEVLKEQGMNMQNTLQREIDAILLKHSTPAGGPTAPAAGSSAPVPVPSGGTP